MLGFSSDLLSLIAPEQSWLMTRVQPQGQPGAFPFQSTKSVKLFPGVSQKPGSGSAVETAPAVEIDQGGLRQLLLDDSHKLVGKASAKTASALPQFHTAAAALL